MEIESLFMIAGITILSLILLILTVISFLKFKNLKLLFVSFIFFFFFIKGLLLSYALFTDEIESLAPNIYILLFDLIVLVLLYIGYSVKR